MNAFSGEHFYHFLKDIKQHNLVRDKSKKSIAIK
jgi:hypothetical protein